MNTVVIVCGGVGSRLTSAGILTPKSLLKIGPDTLIFSQINNFYKFGIYNFYFLLGNGAQDIISHLKIIHSQFPNANFEYITDKKFRGTAGGILENLELLPEKFFVLYGDIYINIDIPNMLSRINVDFDFVFIYRPTDHPFDSNLLRIDEHGKVLEILEKGHFNQETDSRKANVGLMVCNRRVFREKIEVTNGQIDLEKDIITKNFKKLSVFGLKLIGYARDIGTSERLNRTKTDIKLGIDSISKSGIVFLDRDGTINRDIGFFSKPHDFEFLPGTIEAVKLLNLSNFYTVVVTNQSAIARNISSYDEVLEIHYHINRELSKSEAYIDNFYFCPHHPDIGYPEENPYFKRKCECRKPNPGMIFNALLDYEINPELCWLVGDSLRDIDAANRANVKSILISQDTEINETKNNFNLPDYRSDDLLSSIKRILNDNF